MQPLQHTELEEARRHLRRSHQRCRGDRRGRGGAGDLKQPRQMRRHRAGDKPDRAEHEGQHRHPVRRGRTPAPAAAPALRGGGPRYQKPVDRQADEEVERRPAEAGAAPAETVVEQRRERPPDGAGEARDQGDAGDRRRAPRGRRARSASRRPSRRGRAPCRSRARPRRRPSRRALAPDASHSSPPPSTRFDSTSTPRPPCRSIALPIVGPSAACSSREAEKNPKNSDFRNPEPACDRVGEDCRQIVARAPGQGLRQPDRRNRDAVERACMTVTMRRSEAFDSKPASCETLLACASE